MFTNQFCFDLGRTFAIFLDKHKQVGPVAIGLDSRSSSPHISDFVISGLNYQKKEVLDLGTVPVSATHYAILSTPTIASIMVTGSHIDITSNGVKFFALKEEINKAQEREIEKIYYKIKGNVSSRPLSTPPQQDISGFQNYVELLLKQADQPFPKLKIVLDSGNGGQTETIRTCLTQLDQNLITINDNIQNTLISRDTEQDGSFKKLQEKVVSSKADLGVGYDTDGDRVIFIDHLGNYISGDYSGTLLAKWNESNTIVTPVNVSNVIDSIGKNIVRTKVGSPYVVAAMKKYGSSFGFESNGGGIHSEVMMSRDGGTSLIKMLNILKWSNKTLHQLVSFLPKYYIRRDKFDCPTEKNTLILEKAKSFIKAKSIDNTDGLKLLIDDHNWVLFRPSSNAPEFRVFVEANSADKADKLLQDALTYAQNLIKI